MEVVEVNQVVAEHQEVAHLHHGLEEAKRNRPSVKVPGVSEEVTNHQKVEYQRNHFQMVKNGKRHWRLAQEHTLVLKF